MEQSKSPTKTINWQNILNNKVKFYTENVSLIFQRHAETIKTIPDTNKSDYIQGIIFSQSLRDTINYVMNNKKNEKIALQVTLDGNDYFQMLFDSILKTEEIKDAFNDVDFSSNLINVSNVKIGYNLVKDGEQYLGFGNNVQSASLIESINKAIDQSIPNATTENKEILETIKMSLNTFNDTLKPVVFEKSNLIDIINQSKSCKFRRNKTQDLTNKEIILQMI